MYERFLGSASHSSFRYQLPPHPAQTPSRPPNDSMPVQHCLSRPLHNLVTTYFYLFTLLPFPSVSPCTENIHTTIRAVPPCGRGPPTPNAFPSFLPRPFRCQPCMLLRWTALLTRSPSGSHEPLLPCVPTSCPCIQAVSLRWSIGFFRAALSTGLYLHVVSCSIL